MKDFVYNSTFLLDLFLIMFGLASLTGWVLYFYQRTVNAGLKLEIEEIKKELRREREYQDAHRKSLNEVIQSFSAITGSTAISVVVKRKVDEIFEKATRAANEKYPPNEPKPHR